MTRTHEVKDMVKLHRLHSKFTFGRFEGKTLRSVINSGDGDYILLAMDSIEGFTVSKKVKNILVSSLLVGEPIPPSKEEEFPPYVDLDELDAAEVCQFGCLKYDSECYSCGVQQRFEYDGRY